MEEGAGGGEDETVRRDQYAAARARWAKVKAEGKKRL